MTDVLKIRENKEQFWIPNQVYREFSRNAKSKKDEVIDYYKNARINCVEQLQRTKDIVGQTFENFRRKQRTDGEELKSSVLSDFQAVIQKFKNGYEELEKSIHFLSRMRKRKRKRERKKVRAAKLNY